MGLGIPRNAYAYVKQSKDHGKDQKGDEKDDDDEDTEKDKEEDEEVKDEVNGVDWTEIRPTPQLEKDYEDQNDEATHQSVSVTG